MKGSLILITILLIFSVVAADQIEDDTQIKNNSTINITEPMNISINISEINETNISINSSEPFNLTEINESNITINITEPMNISINISEINETNISINSSEPFNLTEINESNITINITEPMNISINISGDNSTINESLEVIQEDQILLSPLPVIENKSKDGVTRYIYGDSLVASVKNSEISYYHSDRIQNNRLITGFNGTIKGEYNSLPFGQEIKNNGLRYAFATGKEKDQSDLHYFGARYYDSSLGKFISVDPVRTNKPYTYVRNNPLYFVDPDGKSPIAVNSAILNLFYYDGEMTGNPIKSILILKMSTMNSVMEYKNYLNSLPGSTTSFNIPSSTEELYYSETDTQITKFIEFDRNIINMFGEMASILTGGNLIENLIIFSHQDSENDPSSFIVTDEELEGKQYTVRMSKLEEILISTLSREDFAEDASLIIPICNSDRYIDGGRIADKLGINVYLSPTETEYFTSNPVIIYSNFILYEGNRGE